MAKEKMSYNGEEPIRPIEDKKISKRCFSIKSIFRSSEVMKIRSCENHKK
jgi:hypothetical protein